MKPRKPTIEEREKQFVEVDCQDAADIGEWMYRFSQLVGCAHKAQSDEDGRTIVGILRTIDRGQILRVRLRLMQMLETRLVFDRDKLAQLKLSREGGKTGALPRQVDADEWQERIKPEVKRMFKAGKSAENIGALLASEADRSADHVAEFARKVKAELDQGK